MRNAPLPLIGQFYSDDARPWSMQDVCNYLPAAAETEGTRTPTICKTPPGLSPFVQLPDDGLEVPTLPGPIRGLHNAEGRLFAVSTSQLWQITPQGVAIPRGSIGGASRVRMAHNQQTFGNQLIIVNGSSGYLYTTQTETLAPISDDGFPGATDVVFLDGYFIMIEPARRFMFNSDLADGASYNTLDRFTSEVSPDLLVGLATTQNELLAFSERSAEFFENTGAAQQPFRSKRISMERGAASRYGQAHLDNTVFWLGNDGKFYVLEGYQPKRISTRPIEQAIRGLNWGQAFAFVWESEGHAVVYWTFPDGLTWGYDASQGRWHRRASYGLDRWRVNDTAYWNGEWVAGDFQAGRLWTVDWEYPWEYQTEFVSEIVAPVIHDHQNRVLMPRLEVLMDTGMPEVSVREFGGQPTGPTIAGDAPNGTIFDSYSFAYTVTPGDASIAGVTLHSGTLPAGLTLSAEGVLSGDPTTEETQTFTVRVTDTNGLYADVEDTVQISDDAFLADVIFLLHFEGANGSIAITDAVVANNTDPSPNNNWRNYNATAPLDVSELSTTDPLYGVSSLEIASTGFPICSLVNTVAHPLEITGGDFTIEATIYQTSATGVQMIVAQDDGISDAQGFQFRVTSGVLEMVGWTTNLRSSAWVLSASIPLPLNTKQRVAVSKVGATTRIFQEGALVGSTVNTFWGNPGLPVGVGNSYGGFPIAFLGRVDEVRGTLAGRYSAPYTPDPDPFPDP